MTTEASTAYETFSWQAPHSPGRMMTHHWPKHSPKKVIALVHGQGEHGGRYHHVANFFQEKGYATLAVDLTGHGVSAGKRGHVDSYENYLKDVEQLLNQCRERYPDAPICLYGHSMGGNIVTNFALRTEKPAFHKLVISSPWYRLAFNPPKVKLLLGNIMKNIYPAFSESTKLDSDTLSQDPDVAKKYQDDPLVHDFISVGAYFGILKAGEYAIKHAPGLHYPTLLLHGTADRLTSWEASKEFAEMAPSSLKLSLWKGQYHELHNEPNWKEIIQSIYEWMD